MKTKTLTKFFILALCATCITHSLKSQFKGFKSGLTAGVGVSQFTDNVNESDAEVKNSIAFEAGITTAYNFTNYLGLGLDLKFTSLGSRIEGTDNGGIFGTNREDYRDTYKLSYIDIPLYANFNLGIGNFYFNVFAGPSAQFSIKSIRQRDWDGDNEDFKEDIQSGEAYVPAFNYGVGIQANTGSGVFFLKVRRQSQVSDLGDVNNISTRIKANFLSVGFLF